MSWDLTTWNPGDKQKAAWFNRIQNVLAKWGYFGGAVDSQTDLPPTQDEGTFFVVKGENTIYIYFNDTWVPVDLATWSKVVNTPEGLGSIASLSSLRLDEVTIAYFTDSLVDKVNGITPFSYPGTLESYGLRHSDDGNLVVTERLDDIPFSGVKAFAVEEGTTNLVNPDLTTATTTNASVTQTDLIWNGLHVFKVIEDTATSTHYIDAASTTGSNTTAGTTYTISLYAKAGERKNIDISGIGLNADGWYPRFDLSTGTYIGNTPPSETDKYEIRPVGNGWYYISITHTDVNGQHPMLAIKLLLDDGTDSYTGDGVSGLYVAGAQTEQKSFATSFVDGTRQTGALEFSLEQIDLNFATDDWVIAHWEKDIGNPDNSVSTSIGYWTTDNSTGYMWWGKKGSSNPDALAIWAVKNDGTVVYPEYDGIDLEWYMNNWHFHVLVFSDGVAKYYIDGQLYVTATVGQLKPFERGIHFGCHWYNGWITHNSLIANPYIGKAKDKRGSLIWTDDFINYLYNLQRPLFV